MTWFPTDVRVRLPEVDAMGIVYHGMFFAYVEVALQELVRSVQKEPVSFKHPLGFSNVVAHASCDYRAPAYFDDVLTVSVRISKIGTKSLTVEFRINDKQTGKLVAEGKRVHVAIDFKTFKTIPVPEEVRNAFL